MQHWTVSPGESGLLVDVASVARLLYPGTRYSIAGEFQA